ncbi:MAG: hypothetical protein GX417_01000 [Clostridiales bacterium]|nr:hypothetical protein [Clostridiales bacterium]
MKRIFAILITLIGGGITAYNIYAAIADRTYFAKGYAFSSVVFITIGLTLLLIGIRWNINLTKNPDAGDAALKNIGAALLALGILGAGIALTIALVSLKVFSRSAIVIGILPIPGQVFYAAPIVASILTAVFIYSKRK